MENSDWPFWDMEGGSQKATIVVLLVVVLVVISSLTILRLS